LPIPRLRPLASCSCVCALDTRTFCTVECV
jgi:hypothetical protein